MDFDQPRSHSNSVHSTHSIKETDSLVKDKDSEGRSTLNEYTFTKTLGQGAYGKVKLGLQGKEQNRFAVKIIKKDALKRKREIYRDENGRVKYKDAFENILREIAIMKKLNHPNLVRLHEVIDSPDSAKMYLIMEFADKGQIIEWDEEKRVFYNMHQDEMLSEDELRRIFAEIVQGIYYLHQNGVIHRDIKPQNILALDNGTMKIADFGVSGIVGDSDMQKKSEGTQHFMAPECVTANPNPDGYSGKVADLWALGVTFYAFTYYKVPFDGEDMMELFEKIETHEVQFGKEREISVELEDMIRRLLEKDANKRMTLDELINHPWFKMSVYSSQLSSQCDPNTPRVTVSNDEIMAAVTPFERVLFMKLMIKKVVARARESIDNKRRQSTELSQCLISNIQKNHKQTL